MQQQVKEQHKEVQALLAMPDAQLFDHYLRFQEADEAQRYADLSPQAQQAVMPKLQEFRKKAQAAERFLKNMHENHAQTGNYPYRMNDPASLGLTMEEIVATAYWATRDKVHFRDKAAVTKEKGFLQSVDRLYDMQRGYNIDAEEKGNSTANAPNEKDQPRCQGGSINSLAWALNSTHTSYNPKVILEADVERDLMQYYKQLLESDSGKVEIQTQDKEAMLQWFVSGTIPKPLIEWMQQRFEAEYQKEFAALYKGGISDQKYQEIINKQPPMPPSVAQHYGFMSMDAQAIAALIQRGALPLLHFSAEKGYAATLMRWHEAAPEEKRLEALIELAREETKLLHFLAQSNLPEPYASQDMLIVAEFPVQLKEFRHVSAERMAKMEENTAAMLGAAAQMERMDILQALWITSHNLVSAQAESLHAAIIKKQYDLMQKILDAAGDKAPHVLSQSVYLDDRALNTALFCRDDKVIEIILKCAKKYENLSMFFAKNQYGHNSLDYALHYYPEFLPQLLDKIEEIDKDSVRYMLIMTAPLSPEQRELGIEGDTPLFQTVKKSAAQTRILLGAVKDENLKKEMLEKKDHLGKTPLFYACDAATQQALLEAAGKDRKERLLAKDKEGHNLLHHLALAKDASSPAAIEKFTFLCKALDQEEPGLAQKKLLEKNKFGSTPFYCACVNCNAELLASMIGTTEDKAQMLLETENGSKLDTVALRASTADRFIPIAKIFLQAVSKDQQALLLSQGVAAFELALKKWPKETMALLNEINPELLRTPDAQGRTFLHHLALSNADSGSAIETVIQYDPQMLSAKDNDGNTPLHLMVCSKNQHAADIVTKMVFAENNDREKLLFTKNNAGETALHLAAKHSNVKAAEMLLSGLEAEGDPRLLIQEKDREGRTARNYAQGSMRTLLERKEKQATLEMPLKKIEKGIRRFSETAIYARDVTGKIHKAVEDLWDPEPQKDTPAQEAPANTRRPPTGRGRN